MAGAFLCADTKDETIRRINAIAEDTPQLWGTMNAAKMMAHVTHALRVSLAEVETEFQGNFITKNVLRPIVFHTPIPWPKAKIKTAAGYDVEAEGTFEEQKKLLLDAVQRFIDTSENEPDRETLHPVFGMRTLNYWQRLNGRHFDHQLRQFGV